MKQLENDKICKYCFGCNKLEDEQFEGLRSCKCFLAAYENWQERYYKGLKEVKRKEF